MGFVDTVINIVEVFILYLSPLLVHCPFDIPLIGPPLKQECTRTRWTRGERWPSWNSQTWRTGATAAATLRPEPARPEDRGPAVPRPPRGRRPRGPGLGGLGAVGRTTRRHWCGGPKRLGFRRCRRTLEPSGGQNRRSVVLLSEQAPGARLAAVSSSPAVRWFCVILFFILRDVFLRVFFAVLCLVRYIWR